VQGTALIKHLQNDHIVVGVDIISKETTTRTGSVADREFITNVFAEYCGFDVVFHTATLHQPNIRTHSKTEFVQTNVQGTLNLLEEASDKSRNTQTKCFIFTSTTSLMISREIRSRINGDNEQKSIAWISEETCPNPMPRNIYGVTKLSSEYMVRLIHEQTGVPCIILRTSRFFPEDDNEPSPLDHDNISEVNRKVNEFLFRRVSLADVVDAHILAMNQAENIKFDIFLISANSPFQTSDCEMLSEEGGVEKVMDRVEPQWRSAYEKLGFKLPKAADRVYSCEKAMKLLGYAPKWCFWNVVKHMIKVTESNNQELLVP
jgi:UDP-glucose 4-epimerase